MAVNTADKRASSMLVGLPFRAVMPTPSGSFGREARIIAVLEYSGVLLSPTSGCVLSAPAHSNVVDVIGGQDWSAIAEVKTHSTIDEVRECH